MNTTFDRVKVSQKHVFGKPPCVKVDTPSYNHMSSLGGANIDGVQCVIGSLGKLESGRRTLCGHGDAA